MSERSKLVDDVWRALPNAMLAGWPGSLSIAALAAFLLFRQWWLLPVSAGLMYLAYELHRPWAGAMRTLREHNARRDSR